MDVTGIEHVIAHDGSQELGEGDRTPDHQNHQTKEPFQQIDIIIGMHHPQSYQCHEYRDDKCRKTEAAGDEEIGEKSAY